MTDEFWKDIPGFDGLYQASTFGRIRSLPRVVPTKGGKTRVCGGRIIKPQNAGKGYYTAILSKNGKHYTPRVNRLVAITFLPNPFNYPQVNHKDENKANNHVSNLEWCDAKYNTNYGTGVKRRSAKIEKMVVQYSLSGEKIKVWKSIKSASLELGIDNSHITRACKGHLNQTGGYKWKYYTEKE